MTRARSAVALVALVGGACAQDLVEPSECPGGVARQAVLAEDRNILGAGGAYPADLGMRARADALYRSQGLRRALAWQTVAKVLAPVSLSASLPNVESPTLPLWQTWYAKDDTRRIFQHLYQALSESERSERARFAQESIDAALDWNVEALEDLPNWPEERKQAYLQAIDSKDKLVGIAGVQQVGYSPGALRHLVRSYPEILDCAQKGAPDPVASAPEGASQREFLREPLRLLPCTSRSLGPFFVAEGESIAAQLGAGTGLEGAGIAVHSDSSEQRCLPLEGPCTAAGTGTYYVTVSAGGQELVAPLQVDYRSPDAPWAACLESAFPSDAVIVKASWQRAQFGATLPSYATSAEALADRMAHNAEEGWSEPEQQVDPDSEAIYTMELPNGQRYRLAALHIMSKELDHWQWISLWWSDSADTDFGEDRPASITDLGGPWANYKMCTATEFIEGDPDPGGGFASEAPSLAAALAAVHGGQGAPSWCSNPYLEEGPGNMETNCIGCHQHGGSGLASETIIGEEEDFPFHGRTQLRNNFPHDYSWAVQQGDRLESAMREVVDYFEGD